MSEHHDYIQTKVNPLLESLVTQLLLEKPADPIPFMLEWLCEQANIPPAFSQELVRMAYRKSLEGGGGCNGIGGGGGGEGGDMSVHSDSDRTSTSSETESDEDEEEEPPPPPPSFGRKRQSVSAEAYGDWNPRSKEFKPPYFNKTPEQKTRIRSVLEQSFLFRTLGDKDFATTIDAMREKVLVTKTRIIQQGDNGDALYVVESGLLDCFKRLPVADGPEGETQEVLVKTCEPGDAFGELALLYNCPRAASVESRAQAVLWRLDRETFNHIVRDSAIRRREMYDNFLQRVPLLQSMEAYERGKVADALKTEIYQEGEVIVAQGEQGDRFYFVESGSAAAMKTYVDGEAPKEVMKYEAGDYFGELALLRNEPRAASVVATTVTKVAFLDRRSFSRLLGPIEVILQRNTMRYR